MKKNIPITLLTGFLGSGKSTLINRIIKEMPGISFAILLNEFGDVKLESQIIETSEEDIVELQNGCMCCVIRSDLLTTVRDLLARKPGIDHILVEASGLSDPLPIAQTFTMDTLEERIRFSSIVCLLDVVNFSENIQNFQIALGQLKYSDFVLLSKTDLTGRAEVAKIREALGAMAPKAFVYETTEPQLFSMILDVDPIDHGDLTELNLSKNSEPLTPKVVSPSKATAKTQSPKKLRKLEKAQHTHEKVDTFFFKTSQPLDFSRIGKVLDHLPSNVVRSKGFLYLNTPEAQRVKVIFQSVALRNSLDVRPWKDTEVKQSALVFIGKGLDVEFLRKQLESAQV